VYILEVLCCCLSRELTCKISGGAESFTSIAAVLDFIHVEEGCGKYLTVFPLARQRPPPVETERKFKSKKKKKQTTHQTLRISTEAESLLYF